MKQKFENPALRLNCFIGAAINAVSSVIGGAINGYNQRQENQINRQAQQLENAKSRQWQEEMYQKYASPSAQVQQRAQAGLNPYADGSVKSQSVGTASTGSIPAGQASPAIGDSIASAGEAIGNYLINKPAFDGVKLDNETKRLENKSRKMDLAQKAIEMEDYQQARSIRLELLKGERDFKQASITEKRRMIEKLDAEIAALKLKSADEHDESVLRQDLISLQQEYQKIINSHADAKEKADIQARIASACASYANAILAKAQSEFTNSQNAHFDEKREIDLEIARTARDLGVSDAKIKEWEAERARIRNGGFKFFNEDGSFNTARFIKESLMFLIYNVPFVN